MTNAELTTSGKPPFRLGLPVRPSVTPFSQCFSHHIIMKFSAIITIDKRGVHAKARGQRSNFKVTEVKTNFAPICPFPGCNSKFELTDGYKVMHN